MYMNYMTTTNLRTQSSQLVSSLLKGDKVTLIHRSKIIGIIQPPPASSKGFNAKRFIELVNELNLPSTTDLQREKIYRDHLKKKYGKNIS